MQPIDDAATRHRMNRSNEGLCKCPSCGWHTGSSSTAPHHHAANCPAPAVVAERVRWAPENRCPSRIPAGGLCVGADAACTRRSAGRPTGSRVGRAGSSPAPGTQSSERGGRNEKSTGLLQCFLPVPRPPGEGSVGRPGRSPAVPTFRCHPSRLPGRGALSPRRQGCGAWSEPCVPVSDSAGF